MPELDEQLRLLIQQYGIAEVRRRLSAITRPPRQPRARKSAPDYVTGMNPPNNQKERLLTLAQLFEEKRFLPTAADIGNFFEAYDVSAAKVKARQVAIPHIFRFLSSLSDERLDRIINEGSFTGPSELGPIADAIKAKSVSMGNRENTASSSGQEDNALDPLHRLGKANA
jgi:hypothetical protein